MSDDPVLTALGRLESGQMALQEHFMTLQERFMTLQGGQMALQERFTVQEAGQMALQERFTTLEAGQTALRYSQAALQDSQTSLRIDTMARMDRLENKLTEIRDDISVNMGSSERAHEAAANTRTELRSLGVQVNVMWRQMKRLEQQVRDITGDP